MDHRFRKFLAIAETGSFSAAAKQLHVTQPAITLAVGSLERAFGVKLYIRKKYRVELTPAGETVAKAAKKIAQTIDTMEANLAQENTQLYQVGIIDSIAHLLYSSKKSRFTMRQLDVMVDNSRQILQDLSAKKIDGGVITGQPGSLGTEIMVHKLHNEEFVFVTSPARAPLQAVSEVKDWLAINKDSTTYRHFVRLFRKEGLRVTPIFYSTSMELLKEMAIAGNGTALLPRHLVHDAVEHGTLSIIKTIRLYRPIWAVIRKNQDLAAFATLSTQLDTLLDAKQ